MCLSTVQVEGRTMDEEVFTDTTGISTFRQTLFYTPQDTHNNRTLRWVKPVCETFKPHVWYLYFFPF
jgi:hypothetical protein